MILPAWLARLRRPIRGLGIGRSINPDPRCAWKAADYHPRVTQPPPILPGGNVCQRRILLTQDHGLLRPARPATLRALALSAEHEAEGRRGTDS